MDAEKVGDCSSDGLVIFVVAVVVVHLERTGFQISCMNLGEGMQTMLVICDMAMTDRMVCATSGSGTQRSPASSGFNLAPRRGSPELEGGLMWRGVKERWGHTK